MKWKVSKYLKENMDYDVMLACGRELTCPSGIGVRVNRGDYSAVIYGDSVYAACTYYKKKDGWTSIYTIAMKENKRYMLDALIRDLGKVEVTVAPDTWYEELLDEAGFYFYKYYKGNKIMRRCYNAD